jgi:hypothetical protein
MKTFLSFLTSSPFLAALVAVLLVLSFIPTSHGPAIEVAFSKAGLSMINGAAKEHLREQREQAFKGFLVLSALKAGLAVLRSSEIGLILNVRIGDLAVAAYDYVNFAWKVLLAAVAYYYLAEYLLTLAGVVDIWFLWGALLCAAVWLILGNLLPQGLRLRSTVGRTGMATLVLALLFYIGLPLSMVGAGWVSSNITGQSIDEANSYYAQMGESMPSLLPETVQGEKSMAVSGINTGTVTVPFPYDGSDPSLAVTESPDREKGVSEIFSRLLSGDKLGDMKRYLEERSKALATAVLRQTAAYLFNIVLFPFLMLVTLYFGCRYLISLTAIK